MSLILGSYLLSITTLRIMSAHTLAAQTMDSLTSILFNIILYIWYETLYMYIRLRHICRWYNDIYLNVFSIEYYNVRRASTDKVIRKIA